ncbi:hypothetical protein, partial [Burkholderia sola]
AAKRIRNPFKQCPSHQSEALFNSLLGSVYISNAHANARNRSYGKEWGAPFGRAKQATSDAAIRAISGIPVE